MLTSRTPKPRVTLGLGPPFRWPQMPARRPITGSRLKTAAAARIEVGKPPMPDAPAGVTVKTVEVREILATV
jgi:hypothetical protein